MADKNVCPRCQGLMNLTGEYPTCMNCGHVNYSTDTDAPVVISISIEPQSVGDLMKAVASAENLSPQALGEYLGLSLGQTRQMMADAVIYPRALIKLTEKHDLAPTQVWRLVNGSARRVPQERKKRGRKPKTEVAA